MRTILVGLLFVAAMENPSTIWCDLHMTSFIKSGQVLQNGKCYDLYKHSYNQGVQVRTHEAILACQ